MGNSCSNPAAGEAPWFDTKEVPQVSEVNVLCFNMFVRPPFINNNGDDYKDERLREFTKMIGGYDVICLQEMFGVYSRRREALINEARKVGFLFHAASPRPSTLSSLFIDAGLLVLSRFPITDFEFCPYAMGFGVDYYVQKGILYTKIKIGSASLHLFDTHTQANYEPDISCLLKKTEQFRAFQQFIKTALAKYDYREEDIVLLAGDMNVNARTKVIYQSEAFSSNPLFQGLSLLRNSTTFHEYDAVLGILSDDHKDQLEDLLYLDCGEHPTTFGDSESTLTGDRRPIDTVLTHKNNFCSHQRLDYIFNYIPKTLPDNVYRSKRDRTSAIVKLRPKKGSATVEKFFVKGHPFCQLSDHYGVKVTVLCENTLRTENTAQEPSKPMTDYHDKLGYSVKQAQYKDYGL